MKLFTKTAIARPSRAIAATSLAFAAIVSAGCAASTADEAPLPSGETISASPETTSLTGVTGWEVAKDGAARYEIVGRDGSGNAVATISTHVDAAACANGATVITLSVSAARQAKGTKVLGCSGETVTDALTPASRLALDRLDVDLDAKNAGKTPPPPVSAPSPLTPKRISTTDPGDPGGSSGGWDCAPEVCGCEIKTETKCFGVVLVCNAHRSDCSTSGWRPCGVCLGLPW
jgi:hypothetical protein